MISTHMDMVIFIFLSLQYQGDEKLDTDIPTYLEAKLFCTTFGKFVWVFLQPLFYAFRPVITYPKPPTLLEIVNVIIQLSFDVLMYYLCGKCINFVYLFCIKQTFIV